MERRADRRAVLYLAPCVDFGAASTATIDWFSTIDRERFAPILATTEPSPNRRLAEIEPHAEELWELPQLMAGKEMPGMILDLVHSREVELVHVMDSRLGFELLPDLAALPPVPAVVVQLHSEQAASSAYAPRVCMRYGNLVDCFSVASTTLAGKLGEYGIPPERVRVIALGGDATAHTAVYEQLLARRAQATFRVSDDTRAAPASSAHPRVDAGTADSRLGPRPDGPGARAAALRFDRRTAGSEPAVSAIVPCFNYGRFLGECVDSILAQDYPDLEVIVVDDASTEFSTLAALAEVERLERVSVLRLPEKSGPSGARNRGIEHAKGRFILPVDADDMLAPGAVTAMVAQLQSAGPEVGFIYPVCQYFGIRDDVLQPPSWNVYLLMQANFCDAASLIDAEVFRSGLRYAEDMPLGFEDWDLALALAAREVSGEPTLQITRLARHVGFTRSKVIENLNGAGARELVRRHPRLYGQADGSGGYDRARPPAIDIKARFAPAVSILAITDSRVEIDGAARLIDAAQRQACQDFELLLHCSADAAQACEQLLPAGRAPGLGDGRRARCISLPDPHDGRIQRLQAAMSAAKGRYLLAADDAIAELLEDPALIERMLRTMRSNRALEAIALAPGRGERRAAHTLLGDGEVGGSAHALLWETGTEARLPRELHLPAQHPIESLAAAMSLSGVALQWRHHTAAGRTQKIDAGAGWLAPHIGTTETTTAERQERDALKTLEPALPGLRSDTIERWRAHAAWLPAETVLLCRHCEIGGRRRLINTTRDSPPGYGLERDLGAIHHFAPPGTARLVIGIDGIPRTVPRGARREAGELELGHVELDELPLLLTLERAYMPDGGVTLVAGEHDPLRAEATRLEALGHIEGFPNLPLEPPDARRHDHGLASLIRCIDRRSRRHRYRLLDLADRPLDRPLEAELAEEELELVAELGVVCRFGARGSIEVCIDEQGGVRTGTHRPEPPSPSARTLARWVAAPLAWREFGGVQRARTVSERVMHAVAHTTSCHPEAVDERRLRSRGYLEPTDGPGRVQLFCSVHPVTGDQLLSPNRMAGIDMGYGETASIGYALAPRLDAQSAAAEPVPVPWASRLGLRTRPM